MSLYNKPKDMKTFCYSRKLAHVSADGEKRVQTIEEHCLGVSSLAMKFAEPFFSQDISAEIGLLHDIGKYSDDFQAYIRNCSGYEKIDNAPIRTEHSIPGAKVAGSFYPQFQRIIEYCIAGHHSGLHDYSDLASKLIGAKQLEGLPQIEHHTIDVSKVMPHLDEMNFHLWIRLLFSCLVDADYLDTEKFMQPDKSDKRDKKDNLATLRDKLETYLAKIRGTANKTELNKTRSEIQDRCKEYATKGTGFYSLTVPTGGGKTLAGMQWAINHAIKHNKKRIVVAIPYTSIITQNAEIFRQIFGMQNVVEHHSNIDESDGQRTDERRNLAAENWDAPIIVTTNVQLFESLYSCKPAKCRKLHNLSDCVLILDEVQTLPVEFLRPILESLKALNKLCNTSVLFTTASQPAIEGKISCNSGNPSIDFMGIEHIIEIIEAPDKLAVKLKRTDIHFNKAEQSFEELAAAISRHRQILCIVNTRKEAKKIFDFLPQDESTIHLSRMMCSVHISKIISKIKKRLENNQLVRVISTQLIEAGVDLDFPSVYREESGLDSILQAAGRCNREGKMKANGKVEVFRIKGSQHYGLIGKGIYALNELLSCGMDNPFNPASMKQYFKQLYGRVNGFDKQGIMSLIFSTEFKYPFREIANKFKLIDNIGTPILVNYGEGEKIIEAISHEFPSHELMRKLQRYMVTVSDKDAENMIRYGRIRKMLESENFSGIWVQNDPKLYDDKAGVVLDNQWIKEIYIK
ncbi:MAG: CRISPR-associated helicase Cas3' [Muribaculaceae bacterium]|jgi:CRISPR-associated endonuclease/helicase Cas3|nr:CRISPR-associated helicase Cas3' [Muribaculaceae bacterium]